MRTRIEDPIVAEVRRARAELLARAGGDLRTLVKQLEQRQKTAGSRLVRRPRGKAAAKA